MTCCTWRLPFTRRALPALAAALLTVGTACAQTPATPPATPARPAPPAIPSPTHANVAYGTSPRQILDIWLPKADAPTPVIVYYHGGGFMGGDKSQPDGTALALLIFCQQHQIAFANANYRLTLPPDGVPLPGPLKDGARALQAVRSHAKEWNLDPQRALVAGSSAGAVIALYIGLHPDLADPQAKDDPVARESTRVAGILGWSGATALDPLNPQLEKAFGLNPAAYAGNFCKIFGVKALSELETPEHKQALADMSPIALASKDDPASLLLYGDPGRTAPLPLATGADYGIFVHHAYWGQFLKDKMDTLGVPCTTYPGYPATKAAPAEAVPQFVLKQLGVK